MKGILKWLTRKAGYEVVNLRRPAATSIFPPDFDQIAIGVYASVRPFTLTTPERVFVLIRAVEYILANRIPGSLVECGVWRGGSTMAMARTLLSGNGQDRDLFLYDTYQGWQGMNQPVVADGEEARAEWTKHQDPRLNKWSIATVDEVKANMATTGYPSDRIHCIVGKVEDTLPASAPEAISLLRLDTDFYESTKHELLHLFPLLSRGGVLIVDDYGRHQGSRKAVDEFIQDNHVCLLLNRIDSDSRIGVKV
jgi:O-methyltransferase